MKIYWVITMLIGYVCIFSRCNSLNGSTVINMKDLGQNMQDMMMYHDNLGTHLRNGEADYSNWLLQGMDSCLLVIASKFDQHRRLTEPFEKAYKKRLSPSINDMRYALKKNNLPAAIKSYRVLTYECNGCHTDHDVDKEVMDLSDPAYNNY